MLLLLLLLLLLLYVPPPQLDCLWAPLVRNIMETEAVWVVVRKLEVGVKEVEKEVKVEKVEKGCPRKWTV